MQTERQVVFAFPPVGWQYVNMGRELYDSVDVFRQAIHECDKVAGPLLPQLPSAVLYPAVKDEVLYKEAIDSATYAQPCLFAVEYALGKLVASNGFMPTAVIGHSVGEYVASVFAGVLDMPTALTLVCERSTQMQNSVRAMGCMLSTRATAEQCEAALATLAGKDTALRARVALAAVNGPLSTVIAGELPAVSAAVDALPAGTKTTRVRASHADHSPVMDPICAPLRAKAEAMFKGAPPQRPKTTMASTVTGKVVGASERLDAEHWVRHTLGTVQFSSALASLLASLRGQGGVLCVEMGGGMLARFVSDCVERKIGGAADEVALCTQALPRQIDDEDAAQPSLRAHLASTLQKLSDATGKGVTGFTQLTGSVATASATGDSDELLDLVALSPDALDASVRALLEANATVASPEREPWAKSLIDLGAIGEQAPLLDAIEAALGGSMRPLRLDKAYITTAGTFSFQLWRTRASLPPPPKYIQPLPRNECVGGF